MFNLKYLLFGLTLFSNVALATTFECTKEDGKDCKIAECKVIKISKLGRSYSIKPTKIKFKHPISANGMIYLVGILETERPSFPDEEGNTSKEIKESSIVLDVTGTEHLLQAVSRKDNSDVTVSFEPFYTKSMKKKFVSKMSVITTDLFNRGSTIKIDSDISCSYK